MVLAVLFPLIELQAALNGDGRFAVNVLGESFAALAPDSISTATSRSMGSPWERRMVSLWMRRALVIDESPT